MNVINSLANESIIERAANARWGVESRVLRHDTAPYASQHKNFGAGEWTVGSWYALFVLVDGDWQIVGRRRTLAELLTMVESRATPFVQMPFARNGKVRISAHSLSKNIGKTSLRQNETAHKCALWRRDRS
jgi:hypothetical protein